MDIHFLPRQKEKRSTQPVKNPASTSNDRLKPVGFLTRCKLSLANLCKFITILPVQINPEKLQQVRTEFFQSGRTVVEWARLHQFRQDLVYAVLSGRSKASRGESHKIAVVLGLKGQRSDTLEREVETGM